MLSQISLWLFVLSQKRCAPSPKQAENRYSPQISPELTRDVVEEFFLFEWPIFCNFSSLWAPKYVCGERCSYLCKWWPSQRWIPRCSPWRTMPLAKNSSDLWILFTLLPPALKTTRTSNLSMATYGFCPHPHCLTVPASQWVASQLRSGIQRLSTGTRNFTITISHSEAEILVDSLHRDWTLTGESAVQL